MRRAGHGVGGLPVEQHTLGRVNAQAHEALGVQQWQLNHLTQLLQRVTRTTDLSARIDQRGVSESLRSGLNAF